MIGKAAVPPAMTSVGGWAAELVQTSNLDFLQLASPASIYAMLSARPSTIRVPLDQRGPMKVPSRAPTSPLSPFVREGDAIKIRKIPLSSATIPPKKCAVITTYSEETLSHSIPSIQRIVPAALAADVSVGLDAVLLGSNPADDANPPGLLHSVTATPASTGTGLEAFAGDVRALAAAIETSGAMADPVVLMSSTSALLVSILALGGAENLPVIASPNVGPKRLIMVDAADFVSAEGDTPTIKASISAALHEEDTTPLPLSASGVPNVVAAPLRSLLQTDAVALRLVCCLLHTARAAGR